MSLSDDNADIIRRALLDAVRGGLRAAVRRAALHHEVATAIGELEDMHGEKFSSVHFKTAVAAKACVEALRDLGADYPCQIRNNMLIVPKEHAGEISRLAVSRGLDCAEFDAEQLVEPMTDQEREVLEEIRNRSDADGRAWDHMMISDPRDGVYSETLAVEVASKFREMGFECEPVGAGVVFPAEGRDSMIDAVETVCGEKCSLASLDADIERAATERQLELIETLHDEGAIDDAELASFGEAGTFMAARNLLNAKVGPVGGSKHTFLTDRSGIYNPLSYVRTDLEAIGTLADKTMKIGNVSPDIVDDTMAAMRREDIGNTQTTADYVQSRPNTGDMDKSTPYGDQCDPAGAGDIDGDGIRDAAEDRDGDGIPDDRDEGIDARMAAAREASEYYALVERAEAPSVSLEQVSR